MFGHPGPRPDTAAGAAVEAAQAQVDTATNLVTLASTETTTWRTQVDRLHRDLARRQTVISRLRATHGPALAAARARRETTEDEATRRYVRDATGHAGPAAVHAVAFALTQRGKPYEWGAEGPDRYDCSGLVQTAYAHAGVRLPRTARPQYRATPRVPVTALLPGDLLFFATDHSDWNTIHHVAIYLGHGRMLHAPTTGDVVRIAPIWWEEFYAATRVVPAAPTPSPRTPTPAPRPTPPAPSRPHTPPPTTPPPPTPTPRPSPTRTPDPSPPITSPPPSTSPPPAPPPPTPSATLSVTASSGRRPATDSD